MSNKLNYSLALSTNEPIGTNKDNGNVISKKCDSRKSDNMALNKVYVNVEHSKCWTLGVAHMNYL